MISLYLRTTCCDAAVVMEPLNQAALTRRVACTMCLREAGTPGMEDLICL
jgi:hypothetical protein